MTIVTYFTADRWGAEARLLTYRTPEMDKARLGLEVRHNAPVVERLTGCNVDAVVANCLRYEYQFDRLGAELAFAGIPAILELQGSGVGLVSLFQREGNGSRPAVNVPEGRDAPAGGVPDVTYLADLGLVLDLASGRVRTRDQVLEGVEGEESPELPSLF